MDAVNVVTPWAALGFVTYAVVTMLRYLRGRDWNGVVTLATVWVSGSASTAVFGQSHVGDGIVLPITGDLPLGALGFWDLLIVGIVVGSTAVAGNELRGSLDRTTTTAKPKLLTGNTVTLAEPPRIDPPPPPQ